MYVARNYDTRLDRFRRARGLPIARWAHAARMRPSQLRKYRADLQEPTAAVLANLVRGARQLTNSPVKASDLYDLGEDEPVNTTTPEPFLPSRSTVRRFFDTRFDRCLVREGIPPTLLARRAGLSRLAILRKRSGVESPSVRVIATLVRTMRQMGRFVIASDLFDLGETDE